jgi:hypothetical protein
MKLIDRVWTCITYVLSCLSLSPFTELGGVEQAVLPPPSGHPNHGKPKGPSFKPPGGRLKGPGADFTCEYPSMTSYTFCSKPGNRSCWLTSPGFTYDINTNYETNTPQGIQRNYSFDVSDYWINGDGMNFTEAKVFNKQYPGPYIQACWGDVRIFFSLILRLRFLNFLFYTDNTNRPSPSPSPTVSGTMEPVFIGTGFGSGTQCKMTALMA